MKHFYLLFLLIYSISFSQNGIDSTQRSDIGNSSNKNLNQDNIKIFPNPASGGEITITSNKDITVQVYDVLGKKVKQQNITPNQKKLNISSLKKGIYLLRLKSDSGTITKKLIRQ